MRAGLFGTMWAIGAALTAPVALDAQAPSGEPLVAAELVVAAPARGLDRSTRYDEGYFELFVERLPGRAPLLTLVDERGTVLIPLRAVLDHVGIPTSVDGDALVLEWPPEVWRTVLDPVARTIVIASDTVAHAPAEWVVRGGESYLAAPVLARVLGARVEVRFADLLVVVSGNGGLPAIVRLEQEARRARGAAGSAAGAGDPFGDVDYVDRTGGVAAGWGVSVAEADGATNATARATLGGSVLGGATEAGFGAVLGDGSGTRVGDAFLVHSRAFPTSRWIRRLDVGTVLTEGTVARRVTGFTATNAPLSTPAWFGDAVIAPAVPAGWEYEVYQGEHLVGVSSSGDPIRAPLGYGNTPVRVRLLGPAGQEVEQDLVYVVPTARVTPGSWRYAAGGGLCRDDGCDAYGFGSLSRGFATSLTAGLGGDLLVGEDGDAIVRPFGRLGYAPRPNLSLELQSSGGAFGRAALQWVGQARGSLSAAYTWTGPDEAAFGVAGWTGQLNASGLLPGASGRWLNGRLHLRGRDHGRVEAWQAALSTMIARTHLSVELESGLQQRTLGTVRAFHTFAEGLPVRIDDAALTAALGLDATGFVQGEVGASIRTASTTRIDARVRLREDVQPTLTLGVSLRSGLGFFHARRSAGASGGTVLGADGGFAWGSAEGLHAQPSSSVGWGGVAGVVFQDLDGDGVRDADEPPVADAVVLADGRRVRTDAEGRYRVWGLRPYEGLSIGVDPLSLTPGWAPERSFRLRPSPNMFSRTDLPVHPTRELMGSVSVGGAEGRVLGGVRVEVVDASGEAIASARTFADGVFYFESLPPGRYRVRVADRWAPVPGAVAVAREVVVPPTPGPAIEVAPLTFERTAH